MPDSFRMKLKLFIPFVGIYTITIMLFFKIILNNKRINIQLLRRNNENYESIPIAKINILNEVIEDILLHQEQFIQEEKQFRENWLKYNGCELYLADSKRKHFTVTSLWRKFCDLNYYDVTMAIQLSVDRIELLGLHDKHWAGPMSMTLYVQVRQMTRLKHYVTSMTSLLQRNNVDIHIVVNTGVRKYHLFPLIQKTRNTVRIY